MLDNENIQSYMKDLKEQIKYLENEKLQLKETIDQFLHNKEISC